MTKTSFLWGARPAYLFCSALWRGSMIFSTKLFIPGSFCTISRACLGRSEIIYNWSFDRCHSLDKIADLVFGSEWVDDFVNDNHAVVHVQPRHDQAVGGLSENKDQSKLRSSTAHCSMIFSFYHYHLHIHIYSPFSKFINDCQRDHPECNRTAWL